MLRKRTIREQQLSISRTKYMREESYDSILSSSKFDRLLEADTTNIQAKNPGIADLPENAWNEWSIGKLVDHFSSLSNKEGKQEVSRIVNNIARWNENKDPELSDKAKSVMAKLHDKWESEK